MPGSKWRFVLTDLKGVAIGEIKDAYERKFTSLLSKTSTASLQLRRDNAVVPYLFNEEDYLLQVWNNNRLEMWGPILTANLAMTEGAPPTIAITAADPSWRLGMRSHWGFPAGFTQTGLDKAIMARELINYQQLRGEVGVYNTGLGIASSPDTCGSVGTYTAVTGKTGLECIQDLAQGFDGFDWYIEPLKGAQSVELAPYMPYIGAFRAAATVGSAKLSAAFEFGIGRLNVKNINFLRDQTTRANQAFNISEEGTVTTALNPSPIVAYADLANFRRYGLYETIAELSGVPTVALREKYVQEVVEVRKMPRRVLTMTSDIDDGTGRVPVFGADYWLGDTVTARAYLNGTKILNGTTRVYGCEVTLTNAGTATYTPILVQES